MEKIGKYISEKCYEYNTIKYENKDVVEYGVKQLTFFIGILFLMFMISFIMKEMVVGTIYCCIYMVFSIFTGGYHAKNRRYCTIKTISVFIGYLILIKYIPTISHDAIIYFGIPLYLVMVWKVVPVRHKNKEWNNWQIKNNKKIVVVLTLICFGIRSIIKNTIHPKYTFALIFSILISGILVFLGALFNEKE